MYFLTSLCHVLLVLAGNALSQDVIFGGPPIGGGGGGGGGLSGGAVGDRCLAKNGRPGLCKDFRDCPEVRQTFLTDPPALCGFTVTSPIVCCPRTEAVTEDPLVTPAPGLDISPPKDIQNFACGESATKLISFGRFKRSRSPLSVGPFVRGPPKDIDMPVVGGIESNRNAWPWMALIGARKNKQMNWFCGGVLINKKWVLSAAHCLQGSPEIVRLGEHNYESDVDGAEHVDYEIARIVSFPNYTYPVAYHDLALLELKREVTLHTYILPVCLPWGRETKKDLTGTRVKLTGWGDTQFAGTSSSSLQEVDITVFPTSRCQSSYSRLRQFKLNWPNGIGEETVCAGDVNGGRDACQGDSGGPLTYRGRGNKYILKGIVSSGYGCGNANYPGIYVNIQYPLHLAWIKKVAF